MPENQIETLLENLGISAEQREGVAALSRCRLWDEARISSPPAVPYRGVLSVIRWFHQPGTRVVLHTGDRSRSEGSRSTH